LAESTTPAKLAAADDKGLGTDAMMDHVEVLRTWMLSPATEGVHTNTRAEAPPISAAPQPEPAMGTSDATEKLPALLMLTMAIKLAPHCSVPQ